MHTFSGSIMKTKAFLFVAVLSAVLFEGCSGDDSTKASPEAAAPETAGSASVTRKAITDAAIAASGSDAATADAWLWAASLVDLSFDGKPEPMVVPSYRGGDGRWVCPAHDAECDEYPAGLPETVDVANARREAADSLRATFASRSHKGRSKIYAAQTVIEVHREIANIDMAEERSFPHDPSYLRTQLEIIKSTPLIEQVVREGNLLEELGMASGGKAPGTARSTFDRTVRFVKSHTHFSILPDTDLIAIQVRLDRPEKPEGEAARAAARIANLFAEVYKNHVREQSRLRVLPGIVQLEANLEDVDRQIGEQEERYRQLRERYGADDSAPDALEMERMKQDLEVLKALRAQIQMRSMTERLNLEMPKTSVRVIEPATVPEVPVPARLDVSDTVLVAEFHLAGGGRLLLV